MKKKNARRRRAELRKLNHRISKSINANQIRNAFDWLIVDSLKNICTHGNTKWKPFALATLTLLWSISGEATLGKAFLQAHSQALTLFGSAAVSTYQGLMKALVAYGASIRHAISRQLQKRIKEIMGNQLQLESWTPFAIDGSTARPPRTKSNEKAFIAANYGKSKSAMHRKRDTADKPSSVKPPAPRILIAMIWQMTARLPWCWKLGRAGTSERTLCLDMLQKEQFVKDALFVGDAGFVGYVFWKTIADRGYSFLIRVGKNVDLLEDGKSRIEIRKNLVYYWPDKQFRAKKPPLVLRLIRVTIGNRKMALITNILEPLRLSDNLAITLYKMRWGIELEFRSLKQVFQRRNLRCKNSERCEQELDWSILAMCIIDCYALKLTKASSPKSKPPRTSFALGLAAFRESLSNDCNSVASQSFNCLLELAQQDTYDRKSSKQCRNPRSGKSRPPTGLPNVVPMSREQRLRLKNIQLANAA